jgi:hypothetical protein
MIISQLIDCLIDIKIKMSQTDKHDFNELRKNLKVLNLDCDECGNVESVVNNWTMKRLSGELNPNQTMTAVAKLLSEEHMQPACKHENTEYQPAEPEYNVHESYNCEDCGTELPLPEPDEDSLKPDGEDR